MVLYAALLRVHQRNGSRMQPDATDEEILPRSCCPGSRVYPAASSGLRHHGGPADLCPRVVQQPLCIAHPSDEANASGGH